MIKTLVSTSMAKKTTVVGYTLTTELLLQFYLIVFMTIVGFLKASGKLRHKNSRVVGLLELFSGALLLPGWSKVGEILYDMSTSSLYLTGAYLICIALGIVTGDESKRLSPACWLHLFLIKGFVYNLSLDNITILEIDVHPILFCPFFFTYGHVMGRTFGSTIKTKTKKH